jgi:excisionase family DNA binding protein
LKQGNSDIERGNGNKEFFIGKTEEKSEEAVGIGEGGQDGVGYETRSLFFENRTQREWLSTEEAAHFLSVSANALRIMVHRDQIRVFKLGRRLRFRLQDCRQLFLTKGA